MPFNININQIVLGSCLLLAGLFARVTPAQAQTQDELLAAQSARDELARSQFIEITTRLRSAPEEQQRQIVSAYELFSQITQTRSFIVSSILFLRAPMPPDAAQLSPQELADFITKRVGAQYLSVEAKAGGRELLRANLEGIKPLIHSDLRSPDSKLVKRGLDVLQQVALGKFGEPDFDSKPDSPLSLWMGSFYDDVEKVFNANPALEQSAVQTMTVLRDPRAIALLIGKDPKNPTRYYEQLASLSKLDPKNPALLGLVPRLDSPNARQRFEALWVLGAIDESLLLPHVRRLLDDPDAQVRWLAVNRAFAFKNRFEQFKPRLLKALNDRDEFVSYVAASAFVRRNDAVAAPTLLRLLQSPTSSLSVKSAVADDVRRLMGHSFNYAVDGSVVPQPNIVQMNQFALEKFAQWIQQHPA